MNRDALDPLERETVTTDERRDGVHGEVTEMLVIDRVELGALDHVAHVRHFDHRDATRRQHRRDPAHEAVQIGDVRHDVQPEQHVGALALGHQARREIAAEELD